MAKAGLGMVTVGSGMAKIKSIGPSMEKRYKAKSKWLEGDWSSGWVNNGISKPMPTRTPSKETGERADNLHR